MTPNELTPMQRTQLGAIYAKLAKLLPLEGRDYALHLRLDDAGKLHVTMSGLSPFGAEWVRYCNEQFKVENTGGTNQSAQTAVPTERAGTDVV